VASTADVNSVPDNYTLRVGANYTYKSLVFTGGLRYEGAPAHDLFGKMMVCAGQVIFFLLSRELSINLKHHFYTVLSLSPSVGEPTRLYPDRRGNSHTGNYTITGGDFASLICSLDMHSRFRLYLFRSNKKNLPKNRYFPDYKVPGSLNEFIFHVSHGIVELDFLRINPVKNNGSNEIWMKEKDFGLNNWFR